MSTHQEKVEAQRAMKLAAYQLAKKRLDDRLDELDLLRKKAKQADEHARDVRQRLDVTRSSAEIYAAKCDDAARALADFEVQVEKSGA